MTVRGAGTNLSGGTIPDSEKSVVISTQKLNRILEINVNDLYAVVEPGVITATFAAEVAKGPFLSLLIRVRNLCRLLGVTLPENAGGRVD